MAQDMHSPDPDEAARALGSVDDMTARGARRGLYPRWYAVAFSVWGGALAASIGSWIWVLLFVGGLVFQVFWRKRVDAWILEISGPRDLWVVLALSAVVGAAFIGGYIGREVYALDWAPIVAGVGIAVLLFAVTEVAYGPLRVAGRGVDS